MDLTKRAAVGVSLVVLVLAAAVYLITLTPTVPFWDSGEFIAVSYILGIPHPPGTPFFVLLGRIASLIPIATVAQRVNGMSAIASALAVMFSYLVTLRLIRLAQGPERKRSDEWIAVAGAATGALLLAFSDNFWENSIEAEVYSLMSLAQILIFWLGLKWWEAHEKRPTVGPLLLCVYLMWLSVGLHLGVGMMGLVLLVLVWLVDRKAALLFFMPFLSVLAVTWGLERLAGGTILLSMLFFVICAVQGRLNFWVLVGSGIAAIYGLTIAFGDADFKPLSASIAAASILVPLVLLMRKMREARVVALALFLMIAGYSTHTYLPIRAAQHPAINEGAPATWEKLRDLLERKQYGEMNMFERRSSWGNQLGKEFWRYFERQWPLFATDRLWGALLPLALGVAGAWWHFRREKISFLTMLTLFLFGTAVMIVFLNFTDHEVRDRDYFFTTGYHAYALWIGMGAAWLITWVRDSFAEGQARSLATAACSALVLTQPFLLMKNLWHPHDRRGNYVAHDYAYNMLAPLAPNGFVFTNGDNDTFPLWYIQQVEKVRPDVRVVNLSLLNTDWYIRQLRDEEPKVPIKLDDKTVDVLGAGLLQDDQGHYLYTNRFMVDHILQQDRIAGDGWRKQPYFAVTVPDHMGLDKNFTFEGLVHRVNPDTTGPRNDPAAIKKALYETFLYRGLFTKDGTWDSTVYKDENASTLSRNYAAAHMELAFQLRRQGDVRGAIAEMERVERMFPGFVDVQLSLGGFYIDAGDTARAMQIFSDLAKQHPENGEVLYYYGIMMIFKNRPDEALKQFERATQVDPEYPNAYYAAYTLLRDMGQPERGRQIMEQWLNRHPDDAQARAILGRPQGAPGTPPPMPQLP
jgi:hypothetical protein